MIRLAEPKDAPAIQAFLHTRVQTSMFPLANLLDHGIGGHAPRAPRFWLHEPGGEIVGLYGQTNAGMAMPQCPALTPAVAAALREVGAGQGLIGMLGATDQVRLLRRAWGLEARATRHDADEPGFVLPLDALRIPPEPAGSTLHPITEAEAPLAIDWRAAYHGEVLGTPPDEAPAAAATDIAGYMARDTHRLLWHNGVPVAMTGFNAVALDTVQIGGVYTPPASRGTGLARRALALHLDEARRNGMSRAVLFAASMAAARAYRAIGFTPAGTFSMVLYAPEAESGGTP